MDRAEPPERQAVNAQANQLAHHEDIDRTSSLYHYTSAAGLEGVLRTRSLWATDVAFLNDWQEILYGAGPLIEAMTQYIVDHPYEPGTPVAPGNDEAVRSMIVEAALKELKMLVSRDREQRPHYVDLTTYVACLSESHDDLGQWRGYGQHGYAIGFAKDGLDAAISGRLAMTPLRGQPVSPPLGSVEYGDSAVRDLCDRVMEKFATRQLGAHPATYGNMAAFRDIMPQLAFVKHKAFWGEREWRLVVSPRSDVEQTVQTRVTPKGIVPYVEVAFDQSCVVEIVIGPGGDFHSERAVRMLLRSNDYDPDRVIITQSLAPYRE